jgi:DNA invertase Pin-like site-specific DNA recombinase
MKVISYIRVSTAKQGASGLGLEAQQEAVAQYLAATKAELVQDFVEVESGRKTEKDRPQLQAALEACKKHKATLVVAKLDRLARNVHFVSGLMQSKVKFTALDLPEANDLTIHIMAAFAEHEAKRISERTKAALVAAKARGVVLGAAGKNNLNPNIQARQEASKAFSDSLAGIFEGFMLRGLTQREMARELNKLNIKAARGGCWSLVQVQRFLSKGKKVAHATPP